MASGVVLLGTQLGVDVLEMVGDSLLVEGGEGAEEGGDGEGVVVGGVGEEGLVVVADALGADGELTGDAGPKKHKGGRGRGRGMRWRWRWRWKGVECLEQRGHEFGVVAPDVAALLRHLDQEIECV